MLRLALPRWVVLPRVTSPPARLTSSPPLSPAMAELAAAVAQLRAAARGRRPPEVPPGWQQQFRDSFVPATREQLQGQLLREFHPSGPPRASFLAFASRLDQALHRRYHRLHLHLQALYGPIDPDRDTTPCVGGRGRGSGGGSGGGRARRVVAALSPLLAEANFQPLPPPAVAFALLVQHPRDEAEVSIRLDEYEQIQFWALGLREGPLPDAPSPPRRWPSRTPPPAPHRRFFLRVVLVAEPRRGGGLELASFREVPLEALELLLGRGRVKTPRGARARLQLGLLLWASLLFLNVGLGLMAELKVGVLGLLLGLGAAVAFRGAQAFSRRRAAAALGLAGSRARWGTARHGELLAALTRRAQDEATKEALLAHSFLPRVWDGSVPEAQAQALLQAEVESWLQARFGLRLAFRAGRACERLRLLGEYPPRPPPKFTHGPQTH